MINDIKYIAGLMIVTTLLWLIPSLQSSLLAMPEQGIEMADTLRSNGKIYIVVATLFSIMAGIFIYIFRLDRKVVKLEKMLDSIDSENSGR